MAYAGGQPCDRETQGLEGGGKKEILFEAVTAATACNKLGLKAREVEPNRAAEEDVEILEWNVCRVGEVDGLKYTATRREITCVPDASQIRARIERSEDH